MSAIFDHTLPIEERVTALLSELTVSEKIGQLSTRQPAINKLGIKAYNVCAEGAHGLLVRKKNDQWPSGKSTVFPQPIGLSCTWDKDLLRRVGDIIGTEARIWYEIDEHAQWLTLWFPTIDMERDPRWGRNEEAYGEDPFLAGKLAANLICGVQGDDPEHWKATCAPKHFYGNNMEKDRASTSTNISERLKHEYYLRVFKYAFTEGKAHSFMAAYNKVNGMPCLLNPENVEIVRKQWGCDGYIVSDGDALPQIVSQHKYCKTDAEAIALAIKAGVDNFPTQKDELVTKPARAALKKGLITEEDIDRAVGNMFRTKFRLGMFDPPEVNPYSSITKEQLCCEEHSAVALEAARKAVVLLKNDAMLPLEKDKCGKVLVLGDLAEKNMPDWYSGNPSHAVSPLDAIGKILPKKKIDTMPVHDLCVIHSSKTNGWLHIDNDGNVDFDGNEETRAVFEEIDWGFNAVSYRNIRTKKYLCITPDLKFGCTSDAVWGWFTMEQFLRNEKTGKFLPHSYTFMNRYEERENEKIDKLTEGLSREIVANAMPIIANAAKVNDTVIITLGNHPLINGREGFDRPSIEFPARWRTLIDTVCDANKNVILVLIAGYPYAFPMDEKRIKAVLYTAHGEQDVGTAVMDVIFGQYNPGGRLSQTWYRSNKDLPPMDDYDIINSPRTYMYFDKKVQYPFGHGLSYTAFEYSDLKIEPCPECGGFIAQCTVTNTGSAAGDEVVQLYASFDGVPIETPLKKLVGFERIPLKPGEKKTVTFKVHADELRFYNEKEAAFSILPESITFMAGASSEDIRLTVEDIK